MHFSLVLVHTPFMVQTILRGPDTGVYPSLQDRANSSPGLENLWIPDISMFPLSSGREQTGISQLFQRKLCISLDLVSLGKKRPDIFTFSNYVSGG